jgi:hypothetical protein
MISSPLRGMKRPSGLSGFVWRSSNLGDANHTGLELRLREGHRKVVFFFLSGFCFLHLHAVEHVGKHGEAAVLCLELSD